MGTGYQRRHGGAACRCEPQWAAVSGSHPLLGGVILLLCGVLGWVGQADRDHFPRYPGSTDWDQETTRRVPRFWTSDPPPLVVAWYRQRLAGWELMHTYHLSYGEV